MALEKTLAGAAWRCFGRLKSRDSRAAHGAF